MKKDISVPYKQYVYRSLMDQYQAQGKAKGKFARRVLRNQIKQALYTRNRNKNNDVD
jgi:predicted nuclease of restriction endonuclease-like (RecB) superfamily